MLLLTQLDDDSIMTGSTTEQKFKIIDRLIKLNRLGEEPGTGEKPVVYNVMGDDIFVPSQGIKPGKSE